MSDAIGRGVIELSADSSKLNASINEARRSINSLGAANKDASAKSAASIDRYIGRLNVQNATLGKSVREAELYKLAMRGASDEQLRAANSAMKLGEAHKRNEQLSNTIRTGFIAAAAVAATATVAMGGFIISAINAADHLNDLSKTTGLSVEQLSGLSLAAKQSGTDLDGVADSINKLSMNMGKDAEKFKALGITAKDPLEAFKQLADVFVSIEDPQTRAALGAAALGKSWQSAAPLLAEGGKNIGEMVAKGTRLSNVTKEMAEEADKFNDSLEDLKFTAQGAGNKIAGEMLPALNDIIKVVMLAYEESGKLAALWTSMGALGAFLFTDEFSSATVKIKNLSAEIADLEKDKKRLQGDKLGLDKYIFGTPGEIESKISNLKSQIAGLQDSMKPPKAAVVSPEELARKAKEKAEADKKAAAFIANQDNGPKEAGAKLSFDLDQIKRSGELAASAYSNADSVLQAKRSASLIDERAYYAAKLALIQINTKAQESSIQQEIARLQQEKLSGKEQIDNARKISDAQSKLSKVRTDAATSIEVLKIQETSALKEIERSYVDARISAERYLDTVKRQNDAELAGIGRGTKSREEQAGRNQIEDKFTSQLQGLDRDKRNNLITQQEYDTYLAIAKTTFEKEITLYNERTAAINTAQSDWVNGANEAISNYYDNAKNVAGGVEQLFTNAFQGMEDAFVDFTMNGKASFSDLAKSIIADIIRIQARQAVAGIGGSLLSSIGSLFSAGMSNPGAGANGFVDWSSSNPSLSGYVPGRAIGGPVSAGGLYRVNENRPELLSVAGKQYLMMGNQSGSVDSNAGGSGGVNVSVTVDAGGSSVEGDGQKANQLGAMIGGAVRSILIQEQMPGGILA